MKSAMTIALVTLLSAALAGCTSFGAQPPQRYYVLEVPASKDVADRTPRAATLLVAPTTVSSFYETQDIVYSRSPGTRAYYQLNAWTERPGPRITELLVTRLDRAGSFGNVASVISGVRGDVVLDTHLTEFYHDAMSAPGSVRVGITAELLDPATRKLLARRNFARVEPAATYDAPGAVQAFNRALGGVLDEIAAWVESSANR